MARNYDLDYRGQWNERGERWDADLEMYIPDDFMHAFRVSQNEDGTYECYTVYIGPWNAECTEAEEKTWLGKPAQEFYQWLYENKRVR